MKVTRSKSIFAKKQSFRKKEVAHPASFNVSRLQEGGLPPAATPMPRQTAVRSDEVLSILGIGGHIDSWISSYTDSPASTVTDTMFIGARHWRDGLGAQEPGQIAVLQALVNAGISLVGLPLQNQAITVADHVSKAKVWAALGTNALFALEGPNEPGMFPITYNGVSTGPAGNPTTFVPVAQFMRDYYTAIKADLQLQSIPLWSVSLSGAEPDNAGLQFLTVPTPLPSGVLMPAGTVFADVLNLHMYPMYDGGPQTIDQTMDRLQRNVINNFVDTYHQRFSGYTFDQAIVLPKVITEFGYPSTGGSPNGVATDVQTQAKCILNGLMNAWYDGYKLVSIYDMYDLGDGFGMFTSPGNPKPAATYLHNLTTVLKDTGPTARTFTPDSISLTYNGLPSSARRQLFQKSSGQYEIVVWNNVNNWDYSLGTPITVSPVYVTITLNNTEEKTIKVFDPTVGLSPVQNILRTRSVSILLSDHPVVVQIEP